MSTQLTEIPPGETSAPTGGWILIAKIKPGQVDAALAAIAGEAKHIFDPDGVLARVGTVHFARFTIFDGDRLLFASHFDGGEDVYLDDFFTETDGAREEFDPVLRYCEDWPSPGDHEGFVDFWKSHRVNGLGIYCYYPGVTCKEIENSVRIRRNMEAVLEDFQ